MTDAELPLSVSKSELPTDALLHNNKTGVPADEQCEQIERLKLERLVPLAPRRKVNLSTVSMSLDNQIAPVETLEVSELKGIGAVYTPHTAQALSFRGIAYKPEGEFETIYQLVAGSLLQDPRILARTKVITFVPAYFWNAMSMVIAPFRMTKFGAKVFQTIQSLQPSFPEFKVFSEWNETTKRHVVHNCPMSSQERELIQRVVWPTEEEIRSALEITAFDDIESLAAANDEVHRLLQSEEVR